MSTATFEINGVEEMRAKMRDAGRRFYKAAAAALYEEGLAIRTDAMRRCPVDTGRLRATCYVTPADARGFRRTNTAAGEMEVAIGFDTDYAIAVHERTEVRHPTGEAKFLENAINEASSGYADRIAERISRYAQDDSGVTDGEAPSGPGGGS